MKAAGEGGGQSLTYSRQRDSGLPCVSETESQKSNARPPATTHLGPLSLCQRFFSFPSGGAGASLGTLISGVKKIRSPFSTSSTEAESELQII